MRSSSVRIPLLSLATALSLPAWSSSAHAQQQAQGFDLERLYTSAPGAGWFVMDALDMHGGLGGAVDLVASYARNPLRVTNAARSLDVVSDEAFMQVGAAATYDRFRLYASFDTPIAVEGNGGTIGGYTYTATSVDLGSSPDAVTHARLGLDARLLGGPRDAFRLGLGAQLWIPGGAPGALQSNYLSDGPPSQTLGAYNAMFRILFAGDVAAFTYAAHLGVNVRGLDQSPQPESPEGSEALFGIAGGARFALCAACAKDVVIGPEVFGETAFRSFLGTQTTGVEGLFTSRIEGTSEGKLQLRLKLGAGGGLDPHFGAPEARFVFGVELFERTAKP
jgi:hypothetical protein